MDLFQNHCGIDVLQKCNGLAVFERPNVGHPHRAGLTRLLVIPGVFAVCNDVVPVRNQAIDDNRPIVTEFTETHEDLLKNCLRADIGSGERKSVSLGPLNLIVECGENRRNIPAFEIFIKGLDDFLVCHVIFLLLFETA